MTVIHDHGEREALALDAAPCPCCGAYRGTTLQTRAALLAVCDVLVTKALEAVGKRIVRSDRSRFAQLESRPWHLAHTLWPAREPDMRGLDSHWLVIPALLEAHASGVTVEAVVDMVDSYARDLLITGTPHDLDNLRYRFYRDLRMTVAG